jgi:hypothetical protein
MLLQQRQRSSGSTRGSGVAIDAELTRGLGGFVGVAHHGGAIPFARMVFNVGIRQLPGFLLSAWRLR